MSNMNREQRRQNERSRREMLARDRRRRGRGRGRGRGPIGAGAAKVTKAPGVRPAGPPPLRGAAVMAGTMFVWTLVMATVSLAGLGELVPLILVIMVALSFGSTYVAHKWAQRSVLGLIGFVLYVLAELTRTGSLRFEGIQVNWWVYFFLPVVLFYLAAIGWVSRKVPAKAQPGGS
ncbi:MAG: hypothetical protein ACYC41_00535 [Bacillota bacterium]